MSQTKFAVFYRNLWGHVKLRDNSLDNKTHWKTFCDGYKEWQQIPRTAKFNSSECDRGPATPVANEKIDRSDVTSAIERFALRCFFRKFATLQNYTERHRREVCNTANPRGLGRSYSVASGVRRNEIIGERTLRRRRSDWIGDEMKGEVAKQAPGSLKSTLEVYEAGKILSKEKCDCGKTKEKSSCPKPKKSRSRPEEGDECEEPPADPCKKEVCVKEVQPKLPPGTQECPPPEEECPETPPPPNSRQCTASKPESPKKKTKGKALCLSNLTPGKKYGFGPSSATPSTLPATTSARSSKPTRNSSYCPPPAKRTPTNSLSRCRSSAPSPPCSASASKCPSPPSGPVACRKPCVPCQPPSPPPCPPPCPPPRPPSPCPSPACPPPKNRCGSPPCPTPTCPPPCPPPSPPPCCPPPSCPKMEALQYDPVCKVLNFYMLNAPTSIRKDEVLVQVVYSGVCGTDLMIMDGKFPAKSSPVILGHEFSGIACAVGSGVTHIKCGDCIAVDPYAACHVCRYCTRGQFGACMCEGLNNSIGIHKDGGWAEFVVVHKNQVHSIPSCLGLGQAVLVQPLSCVVNAMSKIDIPFGADIVIQGTGVSGCLWASVLHLQGHKNVIACDINEYKRKLFQCLDLKYCILPPEKMCDVKADVVIDCTGSGKSIERGMQMLNPQGQLCIFGITAPGEEITIQPFDITKKEAKIVSVITNTNCFGKALTLAEMMGCRYLDYEKLGIQTFKLGQYEGALKMKRCGEISKIVFKIQNSK